ncbi:MAG: peptidoglycan binding protein CsiV [Gammaproteobacteria bacterium]|nr:peptidoglycan binding protein CsiV [Gammaproteobacteria bacterium]
MIFSRKLLNFVIILTCIYCSTAYAQDERWYEVEVLIFSQVTPEAYASEKWPIDLQPNLPVDSIGLTKGIANQSGIGASDRQQVPVAFEDIAMEQYQFQKIREKFSSTDGFQMLLHKAWRQPVYQGQNGTPVLIDDEDSDNAYQELGGAAMATPVDDSAVEMVAIDNLSVTNNEPENSAETTAVDPLTGEPLVSEENLGFALQQPIGPEELRVYGTVTLKWTRFLHLGIDMYFRTKKPEEPMSAVAAVAAFPMENSTTETIAAAEKKTVTNPFLSSLELEPVDFRLSESQRIKTKKIYYFDHPLFGVIAMVTPVDLPEIEEFAKNR